MPKLKSKQVTWSAIEIFVSPTAAMLDPNFAQDLQVLEIRLISCRWSCQSHIFPIISIEGVLSLAPPRDFLPNPIQSACFSHQRFWGISPSPEPLRQLGGSRVCRLSRVEQSPQVFLPHPVHLCDTTGFWVLVILRGEGIGGNGGWVEFGGTLLSSPGKSLSQVQNSPAIRDILSSAFLRLSLWLSWWEIFNKIVLRTNREGVS